MTLPSITKTGLVTGQFIVGMVDGPDAGAEPDVLPATGTITFKAAVDYLPGAAGGSPSPTVLPVPVVGVLDYEGYVCTPDEAGNLGGRRGVRLLANDNPASASKGWTWQVTYALTGAGQALPVPSHAIYLRSWAEVDLTTHIPVPGSPGVSKEQAVTLAADAQNAAADAAVAAEAAAASAAAAATAVAATDTNVGALVNNAAAVTGAAVRSLAASAASGKLDTTTATATYQTKTGLDGAASVLVAENGASLNLAVKAIADASAAPKLDASQKGAASGVATLDAGSKVPVAQIPDAVKADSGAKPVGKDEVIVAPAPTGGDDTAALNTFLTANADKAVRLKPGATYKINSTLAVPTGITLNGNGATIDATALPVGTAFGQQLAIHAQGSLGAALAVSDPIAQWSKTITGITSTVGLVAGDYILVANQEQPVVGMTRTDRDKGELRRILTVDSATQLTLNTGSVLAYGTNSITIQKFLPVRDVTIRNLTLQMGGVGSGHNGIRFTYGRNIVVENVKIDGAEDVSLSLNTVLNGRVVGGSYTNSTNPSYTTSGYGVAVVEGSRHVTVEDNYFYNCRHFVAGGGKWPTIYVDVVGNHGEKSLNAAYDCHEPSFHWTFKRNTGHGVNTGIIIRGQYVTVEDNIITDCASSAYLAQTFDGVTEQRSIRFINNRAIKSVGFGIALEGKAAGAEPDSLKIDCEIVGNDLTDCGVDTIMARHFDGLQVSDNKVSGSTRHGLLLLGLLSTNTSKNLTLGLNKVKNAGGDGIQAQFVDGITGPGDVVHTTVNHGIDLITCNRTNMSGATVRNPGYSGIFINGGAVHSIAGAVVSGGLNASYDAIRSSAASDVSVVGGYAAGARTGVATTGGDNHVIMGVNAKATTSATKVSSDAVNKVMLNNLV